MLIKFAVTNYKKIGERTELSLRSEKSEWSQPQISKIGAIFDNHMEETSPMIEALKDAIEYINGSDTPLKTEVYNHTRGKKATFEFEFMTQELKRHTYEFSICDEIVMHEKLDKPEKLDGLGIFLNVWKENILFERVYKENESTEWTIQDELDIEKSEMKNLLKPSELLATNLITYVSLGAGDALTYLAYGIHFFCEKNWTRTANLIGFGKTTEAIKNALCKNFPQVIEVYENYEEPEEFLSVTYQEKGETVTKKIKDLPGKMQRILKLAVVETCLNTWEDTVLVVENIDTGLNPNILLNILKPNNNKDRKNGQIIFNSQNLGLLNEEILKEIPIWSEEIENGTVILKPLNKWKNNP